MGDRLGVDVSVHIMPLLQHILSKSGILMLTFLMMVSRFPLAMYSVMSIMLPGIVQAPKNSTTLG